MTLSALRTAISYPYPTANPGHGFWGEQTSTLNFCEEVSQVRLPISISSCKVLKTPRIMRCLRTALSSAMLVTALSHPLNLKLFSVDTTSDSDKRHLHVAWDKRGRELSAAEASIDILNLLSGLHGGRTGLHPLSYDVEV